MKRHVLRSNSLSLRSDPWSSKSSRCYGPDQNKGPNKGEKVKRAEDWNRNTGQKVTLGLET